MEIKEKNKKNNFPLHRIYFYLTEGCNLACRHCWINPKLQTEDISYPSLPLDLFQSIIEQAKPLGLNEVKLTGGEPLMHPKIHEILEFAQRQELRITVETNGVLCTPELAAKIAKSKNPFVSVSLDGSDAQTHEWLRGIPGCFDSSIKGIKHLINAGIKPQIIMSIMRHNKDQMEKLVRLAESLGADSVKFNLVLSAGRGEKMSANGETLAVEELIVLGKWVENTLSSLTKLKLYFDYPLAFRPLSRMLGKHGYGCSACGILGIIGVLADGSYALCGIGTTLTELIFGNALKDSLEEIWNNNSILLQLREGIPHRFEGICRRCLMNRVCMGSCIAQNYYHSKTLWAPFWFCDEAHTKGLFPTTRIHP